MMNMEKSFSNESICGWLVENHFFFFDNSIVTRGGGGGGDLNPSSSH
jgi:hypothetical protein